MDYAVGSIAALISGNVTPNGPRVVKRALTPTKRQPSPNVTPKSGLVDDRSIFLSPSVQKKKAIVKKSPKRIFQSLDGDVTNDGEGISAITSPDAGKVKKHLKHDLDADAADNKLQKTPKSPSKMRDDSTESKSPKKKPKIVEVADTPPVSNESTPKKKKKDRKSISESSDIVVDEQENVISEELGNHYVSSTKSQKKKKGKKRSISESMDNISESQENVVNEDKQELGVNTNEGTMKKKKKKSKHLESKETEVKTQEDDESKAEEVFKDTQDESKKKRNKRKKNKSIIQTENQINETSNDNYTEAMDSQNLEIKKNKNKKQKVVVNPNAITNEDTDSEHHSDDDLQSDTEEANKEVLKEGVESSEEDEEEEKDAKPKKEKQKRKKEKKEKVREVDESPEEEIKRTLFVGNVPFTPKCKKEIKRLFSQYGAIDTVRIRTVPVKDARVAPKLAIIKNELHPERTTVNVYVKFKDPSSVDQALVENNTVYKDYHLRVSRSDTTGALHDPKCSVFVGNLPFALEDEALREKFEKCGEIESVRIIRDKNTNAGKGFGYVNFASKDGVELALTMSEEDLTIKNRILRVKRCSQTDRKMNQRGGFHGGNSQRGNFHGGNSQQGRGGYSRGGRGGGFRGGMSQGRGGMNQGRGGMNRGRGGMNQGRGGMNQRRGGMNQGRGGMNQGRGGNFQGGSVEEKTGAFRRIMKRQNQENTDSPPSKRSRDSEQPNKEKKQRKEFVGMTAEKKKKRKIDKGQKKKKALSEILTK